jgi:hypothetical protein
MINRELVEQIVMEVMNELTSREQRKVNQSKPNLLVVGDYNTLDPNSLIMIKSQWNLQTFESLESVELHTATKVVFLNASQDLIVKGALGIEDTHESELLSRCILEYVPVSIIPKKYLSKHLFNTDNKNAEYVDQLISYKDRLGKFSVKVESLSSFIGVTNGSEKKDVGKSVSKKKKKLVTQRDIQDCKEEEVTVDEQTIITPLARDTARDMGKNIIVINSKGAEK